MRKRGANEGSIYRMKDGRWRAAVSVGWKNGKRVRKTFTGKTRTHVSENLKEALRSEETMAERKALYDTLVQQGLARGFRYRAGKDY